MVQHLSVHTTIASAYSASARVEVRLNNSVDVNASLIRAEAQAGPIQMLSVLETILIYLSFFVKRISFSIGSISAPANRFGFFFF